VNALCWSGIHGERVKLAVRRYQFPDIVEEHDANWLVVEGTFTNEQGTWQRVDPCLLTWELHWLARWLRALPRRGAEARLGFLEGELVFNYVVPVQATHCIAVVVDYGFSLAIRKTPADWAARTRDASVLIMRVDDEQLASSLGVIEGWIRQFPVRGELGRTSLETLPGPAVFDDDNDATSDEDCP
jgi:hypothetical protein